MMGTRQDLQLSSSGVPHAHGGDNHMAMFPAGTRFTWAEFKNTFRAHHIPAGVICRKLTEFLALK